METTIFIIIGIAIGIVATYMFYKSKIAFLYKLANDNEMKIKELDLLAANNQELSLKNAIASRDCTRLQEERDKQYAQITDLLDENKSLSAANESLKKELQLTQEHHKLEEEARAKKFDEQLKMAQEQLKTATQEILKQRASELNTANSSQMDAIIKPLKDNIKEMKEAMDNSRDTNNRNTASLEKAIEEVMKRTAIIGSEADKLANALRNENKTQGNWGEVVLSEILESQGLKEGVHYDAQPTLKDNSGRSIKNDDSGKIMRPDVILHYPDGKDAVLDAKVSLIAFLDYQNADTDDERTNALGRHIASVRSHVKELSRKDYNRYIASPRQALSYVIMFVPNESALQLALYNDSRLWREAFESGVFITSEQNLIAALRMIQIAWTQVQQNQNQEVVFDLAEKLLDRVGDFYKQFEDIGTKLEKATETYISAKKKLISGQQSLLVPARKLKEMGAKENAKRPIPDPDPTELLTE